MKQNHSLFKALPIVAAAYAEKFGVKVVVGRNAVDAKTDGKIIVIPNIAPDYPHQECIWGYLGHEAAHVKLTDFDDFAQTKKGTHRKLANIFEDGRIEQSMMKTFPGLRHDLNATVLYLINKGCMSVPNAESHPSAILTAYCLFWIRRNMLGQPLVDQLAETEAVFEQVFPEGVVTRMSVLLRQSTATQSTAECTDLSTKIMKMIEEEKKKEEQEPPPGEKGSNEKGDSGEGNSDQSGSSGEKGDDSNSESTDDTNKGESDQSGSHDDTSSSTGADDSKGNSDANENPGQSSGGQDPSQSSGTDDTNKDAASVLEKVLSAGDEDSPEDAFKQLKRELNTAAAQNPGNSHYQTVKSAETIEGDEAYGQELLSEVRGTTSKIRRQLSSFIQASRLNKDEPRRSGRKFNKKKLCRVATGDTRIFTQRNQKKEPNTAIHILTDMSGSMGTYNAQVAREASLAIATSLEHIPGSNPAVTFFGWSSGYESSNTLRAAVRHGQSVKRNAHRFVVSADGGTPMAEGLWYAGYELSKCREPRKMIIVVTDGAPNSASATSAVIDLCRDSGVECFGIGINSTAVSSFFDQCIVINDVDELQSTLFTLIQSSLTQAA